MANDEIEAGYGSAKLPLLWQDLKDRVQGERGRANARWGWVHPPAGRGKVIWVKAGGDFESIALAAELFVAVRKKRLDPRMVFTFEAEFPDAYVDKFRNLTKVGVGFGPCDTKSSVARVFDRLNPFAVIQVGSSPRPNFCEYLRQRPEIHSIAFHVDSLPANAQFEACYPQLGVKLSEDQCGYLAPPTDAATLITQAQVEPSFGGIVRGSSDKMPIWWAHGLHPDEAEQFVKQWREAGIKGVLFVSLTSDDDVQSVAFTSHHLSEWKRTPIKSGTVVWVDESRWWTALSASASSIYLHRLNRSTLWQALAGGAPTCSSVTPPFPVPVCAQLDTVDEVFTYWRDVLNAPFVARKSGDEARKFFWDVRRQTSNVVDELLHRVYDW